jgi:CHAD domain-containing protein
MTAGLNKISRELTARRAALLDDYDEEDLHQLRVNIRRARALLKHSPDKRHTALRKDLGKVARGTNAARDWDTLALFAGEVLPPAQWQLLLPRVDASRDRARTQARTTLLSRNWDKAHRRWQKLAGKKSIGAVAAPPIEGDVTQTAGGALRASRRALAWEDETSWHKLRIAIKNLRYTLDQTCPDQDKQTPEETALRLLCKRLQTELGDWHDTVVHRGLLGQLADETADGVEPEYAPVIDELASIIKIRGADSLRRVKVMLDHQGWMLAAAAGES